MSLINQMLKDLNERAAKPKNIDALSYNYSRMTSRNRKNKTIHGLLIGFIILLGIVLLISLYVKHEKGKKILATMHARHAKQKNNVKPLISQLPTIKMVNLQSIAIQAENNVTTLRLLLNKNVAYQMKKISAEEFVLTLEKTQLLASIPEFSTLNSAIKNISIDHDQADNLRINLTVWPRSEIKTLEIHNDHSASEIELSFHQSLANPMDHNSLAPTDKIAVTSIKKTILTSPDEIYQEALTLYNQGLYNKSMQVLEKLVKDQPDYLAAIELLANLYIDHDEKDKAKRLLALGIEKDPDYIPFIQLTAQLLINENKDQEALALLEKNLPSFADYPEYHAMMAALYQRKGNYQISAQLYEKLLAVKPYNAMWWMGLGISLEYMGKTEQAVNAYRKADDFVNPNSEVKEYLKNRITVLG